MPVNLGPIVDVLDPAYDPGYSLNEADASRWPEAANIMHDTSYVSRPWKTTYLDAVNRLEELIQPENAEDRKKLAVYCYDRFLLARDDVGREDYLNV